MRQIGGALALFAILIRVCSGLENVNGRLPRFVGVVELFFSSLMFILASCIISELDKQVVSEEGSSADTFREWIVVGVSNSKLSLLVMPMAPTRTSGSTLAQISRMTTTSGLSSVNKCVVFILNLLKPVSAFNNGIVMAALRFICGC